MARKRLVRPPLDIVESAEIHHVSPSKELVLVMPSGADIEVYYLRHLDCPELIVRELNLFLRSQRGARNMANTVLAFLRYVVSLRGAVGFQSLKDYKDVIDRKSEITLNTKAQNFGLALSFVRRLMASGVLPHRDLPKNFSQEDKVHKKTFIYFARYDLPEILVDRGKEVEQVMLSWKLLEHEAQSFVFGRICMEAIRECAAAHVRNVINDWEYVNSIIDGLDDDAICNLKGRTFEGEINKTIELAVSILYANYGRVIPPYDQWPKGVGDWCRKRGGWQVSRICGAFFPNSKTLSPFLVLVLTDERLMPNVDSVAFYAYLDCCMPSNERGMVDVYLDKKRGASEAKSIDKNDITVIALRALVKQVGSYLPVMPGGAKLLTQEFVPAFVHCSACAGRQLVTRPLDKSSPANMVRGFIKLAAKQFPVLAPLVGVGKVTGEDFRPTHAYLKKLSGVSVYKIKEDLNHKNISTTEGYIQGVETQAVQKRRHRDFQRFILDEAVAWDMKRTGSGYVCEAQSDKESSCVDFNGCSGCGAKRIVFE